MRLLLCSLALLIPSLALAQDGAVSEGGIPIAPILAVVTAAAAIVGAVMRWIPDGWKTYANLAAAAIVGVIIPALTDLSSVGEKTTIGALVVAIIGAFWSRGQAGKVS